MRLQQAYLALLASTLARLYPDAETDAERFARGFGPLHYFHLTRTDKVAQAVSLVKAQQSGLWHRNADGSERERTAPAATPVYDPLAIEAEIATLTHADQAWRQWFARERIEPTHIDYEAFARNPIATIRELCSILGNVVSRDVRIEPGVAKLADAINTEWTARYRAERDYKNGW